MTDTLPTAQDARAYAEYITALKYRVKCHQTSRAVVALLTPAGGDDLEDYREELEFGGFVVINGGLAILDLAKPIDMSLWMEG